MKKKLQTRLCRAAKIAAPSVLAILFASAAHAGTLTWNVATEVGCDPTCTAYSSTSPGNYPGLTNFIYLYENAPTSTSLTTPLSGVSAINFGSFQDLAFGALPTPNPNVSSTFEIQVSPTGPGITGTPTLTFYGTVSNPTGSTYNVTFNTSNFSTTPASQVFVDNSYPNPPGPETFVYESVGSYDFGIVQSTTWSGTAKTMTLFGFVAPQTSLVPEPMPFATTALAICGLAGLMIRRKVLAARRS